MFDDPEVGPVEEFSSRGPCFVRPEDEIEQRLKPETTAADGITTSTPGELGGALALCFRCNSDTVYRERWGFLPGGHYLVMRRAVGSAILAHVQTKLP